MSIIYCSYFINNIRRTFCFKTNKVNMIGPCKALHKSLGRNTKPIVSSSVQDTTSSTHVTPITMYNRPNNPNLYVLMCMLYVYLWLRVQRCWFTDCSCSLDSRIWCRPLSVDPVTMQISCWRSWIFRAVNRKNMAFAIMITMIGKYRYKNWLNFDSKIYFFLNK